MTAVIVLAGDRERKQAHDWVSRAPVNSRLTFQRPKRSLSQNAKFYAMLGDIASQKTYHGLKLSADDWRLIFLDALNREMRIVPNLDGTGFVNLGRSSSRLSKADFSGLIEIIHAWCAREGVELKGPQ